VQAFYMSRFGGLAMEAPVRGELGRYVEDQIAGLRRGDANGFALWGGAYSQYEVLRALPRAEPPTEPE
jgi:hypothetical protein